MSADKNERPELPVSLTKEQRDILNSSGSIKINAVAGSGKTSTIIQYAASRPKSSRILYIAFNKSVRLEAEKRVAKFGLRNVQVETAHSLAYKHVVKDNGFRVCQAEYKTFEIAEILGLDGYGEKLGKFIAANHISRFVTYFCNSSAAKVQDLNYLETVTEEKAKTFVANFYQYIEQGTRLLLSKMNSGEIGITHDFYLKMFQLSKPTLNFDYILFDEGQDASAAMLDIFLTQKATKVIVGDTHQQIYGWRHAINSLSKVDFENYSLSTSFRFHQDIANLSSEVLSWKKHLHDIEPLKIIGRGKPGGTRTKATIARSNLGLLSRAITFITEHKEVRYLYFEGNLNSYAYADEGASLYDVLNLFNSRHNCIKDRLIGSMANLEELEEYVEKTHDTQLGMMVEVIKKYQNEIPALMKSLKSKHVGDNEREKAEMIFSTVHRAKGMEYDAVQLVEDFITEAKLDRIIAETKKGEEANVAKWDEEINLLYVAITRTKGLLRIPETLLPKNYPKSPHIDIIRVKKEGEPIQGQNCAMASSSTYPLAANDKMKQNVGKSYYVKQRLKYKNAYERWTQEADVELQQMYHNGTTITMIAEHFGRNNGAIRSRLKKMGCVH